MSILGIFNNQDNSRDQSYDSSRSNMFKPKKQTFFDEEEDEEDI